MDITRWFTKLLDLRCINNIIKCYPILYISLFHLEQKSSPRLDGLVCCAIHKNKVFAEKIWPRLMAFWPDGRNMSWPSCSNDRFGIWKHLLNPIWLTEVLNRPKKGPNMVLKCKFLNHIVIILYEQGLQAEPSIPFNSLKVDDAKTTVIRKVAGRTERKLH